MWLVVCLVAVCSLHCGEGLLPLNLQADEVLVAANVECSDGEQYTACPSAPECLRTCGEKGGIPHGAELSVDGDRATSWQSPTQQFYSSAGETVPAARLTIDLGQAVHVAEVRVWSGEGRLPSSATLSGSLDGQEFIVLSSSLPFGQDLVVLSVLNVTSEHQELTTDQKAMSLMQYLQVELQPPLAPILPTDMRSAFYSVGEVEIIGICPRITDPPLQCYGDPVKRRTLVTLQDPGLHRLLWQRSNQSDLWVMDDVMLIVEECPIDDEWCRFGRAREDFNGTLNPLLWNGDSFPISSLIGPYSCPDLRDPSLFIFPGDQIISRPLLEAAVAVIFGAEFPYPTALCRPGSEYSPVELRQCRSIEGVLGECVLIALVSASDCGNCLDQLTFQLRYLQEGLDSAFFPANVTILSVLHDDIHSTLDALEQLEGLLVVLEVGIGTLHSLPPSSLPLPRTVPRLDLELVPSILSKLEQLKDLLTETPTINVISRDDLILFFSETRIRLVALLEEANQLRSQQRGLSSEVAVLLRALSERSEDVSSARETVEKIAALIASRQNSSIVARVQDVSVEVRLLLEMANRLMGQAQSNAQVGQNLASRLTGVGNGLMAAGSVAADTLRVASEAIGTARDSAAILTALLGEAREGLSDGEEAISNGEASVINGGQLLNEARGLIQNTGGTVPAITVLIDQLNQTVQFDRPRLTDLLTFTCSSGRDNCTGGEEHASLLAQNLTYLINSSVSVYTIRPARDALTALGGTGMPLDLTLINNTALLAQERAQEATALLAGVNSALGGVVSVLLSSAGQLRGRALVSLSASENLSVAVDKAGERRKDLISALGEYQREVAGLSERLGTMSSLEDVRDEASLVAERANASAEEVRRAGERVREVREGGERVEDDIDQITVNVQAAEATIQDTLQRLPLVSRLLAATQRQADAAISNVTGFLSENEKIVADIDSLIAQLSDVHASIALINSPVRLSSEPAATADVAVPYLSLQPPPGRQLEGGVQFEDLDLYMWPSAQYQTPSLIFYAGPVRFPDQRNETQPDTREDVVWVIAEEDQLRLGWELGHYHGNATYPALLEGESQLQLTRVGSQFRLQFSPSPVPPLQTSSIVNNSLLFHSSPRTAFLLGGWPTGSELGSEMMPLPLGSLGGFEGQFQLALFNGGPWGLWNVRSTSQTDLIGDMEFRRNELSQGVAWHASTGLTRTASVLSFDGLGYLFTERFGTEAEFGASFFQIITLYLRPNDASRGLVMYAYQTEISLSLEVAFRDGQLNVLVCLHDDPIPQVLVNHTELASLSGNGEVEIQIRYVPGNRRYTINGEDYNLPSSTARFFTNLQQVKAWFGGAREDLMQSTYTPHEMTGYFGCLDMTVQKVFTVFEIFRGSSFTQYYLNSPLQSRLSATCYATVYVREVSFSAEAEALAYTYLPLSSDCAPTLPLSLSLSLLPLDGEGVVLAASDQESSVLVRLESGQIRVTVSTGTDSISLSSQEQLELGVWHYIHVSLTSFPSQELQLFVNGILHHAIPLSLTSFSLDLPTSAPVGVADPTPVLFLGRVTQDFNQSSNLPPFTGCMRDLTIDLCPVSFQSRSLVDPHPPGVTYHSCPSAPRAVPELPVQPEPPQQRVCLEAEPVELLSTHGGFSCDTSLETSNVAGLFGSEWILTLALRQRRAGHVVTVRSISGATVKVEVVEEGRLALTLISDSGTTASSTTSPLPHDTFTPLTVSCSVVPPTLLCNLTVAGLPLSVAAEAPFTGSVFDPEIPISLGMTQDNLGNSVEGFEGCISDLAINGDMTGFQGVVTDIPCYNQTVPGLGFTGISRIKLSLPSPEEAGGEVRVALTVRPLLETGVVLVLTSPLAPQPVLLVGLVQGELRVSQPSGEYLTLAEGLCDPTNEMVFELSVSYTAIQLSVAVSGGAPANYPPPPSLTQFGELVLTIGNLPDTLPTEADLSLLRSNDMLPASQPAGLVGCVLSHSVQSQPLNLASVTHTNIVNGFCVDN